MPVTDTPLRYPGGKSQLAPLVVDILRCNDLFYGEYIEPFAGGAGIAMKLLLNDYVSAIWLNDLDPSIYAFWTSVLTETDALCKRIENTPVTIAEWEKQKLVRASSSASTLDRGFATFFLNRTNRSGIIHGGVIGGRAQSGDYKLDCRFNTEDLVRKIRRIAQYKDRINFFNLDAVRFLKKVMPNVGKRALVNLDPPYFAKGKELYSNFYAADDHAALASEVGAISQNWMVTYDDADEIAALYSSYPCYTSALNYSAQVKRVGSELLVLDPRLTAPEYLKASRVHNKAQERVSRRVQAA